MDQELKDLKSVLRSLVVSSPTQIDARSLLRDYRSMMGGSIPIVKFGYRDPLQFLQERCGDCFLFQGPTSNPILTLIVPETLKHIDQFVQKQKLSSTVKFKGKRRSVPGEVIEKKTNLIASTFRPPGAKQITIKEEEPIRTYQRPITKSSPIKTTNNKTLPITKSISNLRVCDKENKQDNTNIKPSVPEQEDEYCGSDALQKFYKKRLPVYNGTPCIEDDTTCLSEKASSKDDVDSGRQTSSSNSIRKAAKLEELKHELIDLIADHPDGVWCTDLIRLYRERYGRELEFNRFGYTSILSLGLALEPSVRGSRAPDTGDWLLRDAAAPPPAARYAPAPAPYAPAAAPAPASLRPRPRPRSAVQRAFSTTTIVDPEDALPGIDFDSDVFPADCMHYMDSIPAASLQELCPGAMLEVMVGEVYSPSHLWLLRLGLEYHQRVEDAMDEMTKYYTYGEGLERRLSLGAVRVGHYCSSVYEGDWHRSVIVRVLDSDTVKVRHVDYGTVETVNVCDLKPLRREWGDIPALAVRARMAGVRPPAAGRRWPHAACAHLLGLVRDQRLVANLVAIDREEDIIEVFLINTSTEEDVCLSTELIRSGHAEGRSDSTLHTSECYLYPRFDALEGGHTPNYADIYAYLRDGIALEFVDDYRRHVPACLSPPLPATPSPPPPPRPPRLPTPCPTPSPPAPDEPDQPDQPACRSDKMCASAPEFVPGARAAPTPQSTSAPAVDSASAPKDLNTRIPLMCPYPPHPPHPPPPERPSRRPPPPHPFPPMMPMHSYPSFPPYPGPMPMFCPPPMPMFGPGPGPYPGPNSAPARSPHPCQPRFGWESPRQASPPPPYNGCATPRLNGEVTLSVSECEVFQLLCKVDPAKAQWYMADAIARKMRPAGGGGVGASTLNPEAAEFRMVTSGTQTEPAAPPPGLRPPPGFKYEDANRFK